jgi:hypothetical protein
MRARISSHGAGIGLMLELDADKSILATSFDVRYWALCPWTRVLLCKVLKSGLTDPDDLSDRARAPINLA